MSLLPRTSGNSGLRDDDLFSREPDLRNEPWFKLKDGTWTQDPSRWRERLRDRHRNRAALAALRESNLKRLIASRTRGDFWKIVNAWCNQAKNKITVPPDDLADAFEGRLHGPEVPPPEFNTAHRDAMAALLAALPHGDPTAAGLFTLDILEEEVARAKVLVLSRLDSAEGADASSYREILAIPNAKISAFFSKCVREGVMPNIWNLTILVAVPKSKGPFDNAENVRMIALECCLLKLLTTIIDARIRQHCDNESIIPPSQNGFRPGYRTENNAFVLRTAVETAHSQGKPLYVAFVDLRNAFPSVNRDILWTKLATWGIRGPLIDWLRMLYSDMRYRVRLNGLLSDEMASDLGILMGDPASPLAFLLYIADFTTHPHPDDIQLNGVSVSHLEHADDMVLLSTSEAGLQSKIDDLSTWASLNQMEVNVRKTVVMVFQRPNARTALPKPHIQLHGECLNIVDKQAYVGITFSSSGNMWDAHFSACERRARFAANRILFVESHVGRLPPTEGRLLYSARIDPYLTWGCEVSGAGSLNQLEKLEDVQLYFLRRILGVQSRSERCIIFSELGLWPIKARRLELQLRYLRDLLDLPHSHLAAVALQESLKTAATRARSWFALLRSGLEKLDIAISLQPSTAEVDTCLAALKTQTYSVLKSEITSSKKLEILQGRRDFSNGKPTPSSVLAFRDYLRLASNEQRRALTGILLSDHSLSVERLRRRDGRDYDIPREMRVCRFCREEPEEPLHALFQCRSSPKLISGRRDFWTCITRCIPPELSLASLRALSHSDLLFTLLSFEKTTETLAIHCVKALGVYAEYPRFIPSRADVDSFHQR